MQRPVWDRRYEYVLAGEFEDPAQFLEGRNTSTSPHPGGGGREREYQHPSFLEDAADPGPLLDYLEGADVYRVRAMIEGRRYVASNYSQDGVTWDR